MTGLAKLRGFLRTRQGKVTAGVVGAGGVVAAGLYARNRSGPATGVDQATPAYTTTAGYDGAAGAGYPAAGIDADLLSVFADTIGAQTSSIVDAITANQDANADALASINAGLASIAAGQTTATAPAATTPVATTAVSGRSEPTQAEVNAFLGALAAKVDAMKRAGATTLEIDRYLRSVAVAGGADPDKLNSVAGGPSLARPATAANWSGAGFNPRALPPITATAYSAPRQNNTAKGAVAQVRPVTTSTPVAAAPAPASGWVGRRTVW